MLTRSGLTYLEVSSKVCHDSFFQLGNSVLLPWVIYYEAFYLHVVSSLSCIPVICPKLVLVLIPFQFVYLFCNLSECIPLFFSCISAAVILLASLALIVQVSLPYNKPGRASVLYNNNYTVIRYNNIPYDKPATFVGLVLPSSGMYSTQKYING